MTTELLYVCYEDSHVNWNGIKHY